MTSTSQQLSELKRRLRSLEARQRGREANTLIFTAVGEAVMFGCKVTEGADSTDMIVALEGQAGGDADNHNPDFVDPPVRAFEYPNIASLKGGAFLSQNDEAETEPAPATGTARYDIAYIFAGQSGPGFAIAQGAPSSGVKDDFDLNGLDTTDFPSQFDPDLPVGAFPVARIYVEDAYTGIQNARIADIRYISITRQVIQEFDQVLNTDSDVTFHRLNIDANAPIIDITETNAPANGGRAYLYSNNEVTRLSFLTDDGTGFRTVLSGSRSGSNDVTKIELGNPVNNPPVDVFGSVRVQTAGRGINFAGAGGGVLDHYEEGTFTPVLTDGTNSDATYLSRVGSFTRVGRLVFVAIAMELDGLGTISGSLQINGLPFTISSIDVAGGAPVGRARNASLTAGETITGHFRRTADIMDLRVWNTGLGTNALSTSDIQSNFRIWVSGLYEAA